MSKSLRVTLLRLNDDADETPEAAENIRRSGRKRTPSKKNIYIQALYKQTLSKERKQPRTIVISDSSDDENDDSNNHDESFMADESDVQDRPSMLFDHEKDVEGNKMFSFRTPKKRNGMALLAANTPKTPSSGMKGLSLDSPRTPKSRNALRNLTKTPSSGMKSLALDSPRTPRTRKPLQNLTKTPHTARNKLKRALEKEKQKIEDSEESEYEESDVTDDEDPEFDENQHHDTDSSSSQSETSKNDESSSDEEIIQPKNKKQNQKSVGFAKKTIEAPAPVKRSTRLRAQKQEQEFVPNSDNYFSTIANKKVKETFSL